MKSKDYPSNDDAIPVDGMPPMNNKYSRQTLEMMGEFDYEKNTGADDYKGYLKLGPMKLEEGAYYEGQWKDGERCGRGK